MNSLFSLTVLVTAFAAMIGCTRSQRVCNLDVLETDDYYVDGQHCATNQLPLWSAMESGEAILRVHVREPEEFPIFEFARFFWYVIDRPGGMLVLPGDGEISFGVGPECSCNRFCPRIAFTSSMLHYRRGGEVFVMPIDSFDVVCRMFREQDNESALELVFQGDRNMAEVMKYMKIGKMAGFRFIRICHYYGVIEDDNYNPAEL